MITRHHRCRLSVLVCLLAAAAVANHSAAQFPITTESVPVNVPKNPAILETDQLAASLPLMKNKARGFTVEIAAAGDGRSGYMPVVVHVLSTSKFAADRNLLVRFKPVELGQSPPQTGITCDLPIRAPQGARDVRLTLQLPKWAVGTGFQVQVFEEGVELEDYTQEVGALLQRHNQPPTQLLQSEGSLSWLVVEGQSQQIGMADLTLATHRTNSWLPTTSTNRSLRNRIPFLLVPAESTRIEFLADDWRHYQAFDGVVIERGSLDELAAKNPGAFQALRDWIMSGGTLVVTGIDDSVQQTLGALNFKWRPEYMEPGMISRATATCQIRTRGLLNEYKQERTRVQAEINAPQRTRRFGTMVPPQTDPKAQLESLNQEIKAIENAPDRDDRIWSQSVLGGRVVGVPGDEPITVMEWSIIAELFGYRKSAMLRRGVDPMMGDIRVNRWLIPGVAQPPVYTFIGLLAVFVILVGPIAYRKTTKIGRSYLMFAIAPVLALLTTTAMFTYGVLADGFGTVTRIRQLTWVDGQSGDGFERSRSTYFAGLRPSEGLRFAGDAEVIGYPDHDGESWEELNKRNFAIQGKVSVTEDAQVFDNSFLPSRTQCQFIVHQPRHQIGKLTFTPKSSVDIESPNATVASSFGFPLRNVVLRDQLGEYWTAELVGAGKTVDVEKVEPNDASKIMGDLYNANRPIAQLRRTRHHSSYDRRIRDLLTALNRTVDDSDAIVTDGIFETHLQKKLQLNTNLPIGWFIAESDVSEDLVAVEGAELVESSRYIYGTLP